MSKKHIHFIGICGVAMSALAIALQKEGHKITGSDKGFYPPVSDNLKKYNINFYPGWHPEKMTQDGNPDLVVVGNVAGSQNPEWLYVQEHTIPYKSYPEVIAEFFIKKTSIVAAGTYGKSTSSAILSWMLTEHGYNPSYMFGGVSLNDIPSAALSDGAHSILEGDEYKTSRWDPRPKFAHYSPTHLFLTSVVWDHADVYPTEQSYIDAFQTLVESVPESGRIVVSAKVINTQPQILEKTHVQKVTYGRGEENDYRYTHVTMTKSGVDFDITHDGKTYHIHTDQLGDYMADNMTGCFALAHGLGLTPEQIVQSLGSFKNIKRRLEKRLDGDILIFDDIAHSPKKAEATLRSLKNICEGTLYAVYEPNSGNRLQESIPGYSNRFTEADTIIIPRLSRIKRDPDKAAPLDGQELTQVITETHGDVRYMEHDEKLVEFLGTQTKKGDVIAFLGSHGFRGMIEELVSTIGS